MGGSVSFGEASGCNGSLEKWAVGARSMGLLSSLRVVVFAVEDCAGRPLMALILSSVST